MKITKKHFYLTLVVLILAGVGYLCRGLIRERVIPQAVEHYRINTLTEVHQNEYKQLHKPFETLGLYFGDLQKPTCHLSQAKVFSTTVSCDSDVTKSVHLGQSALELYMQQAPKVEAELKQQGWKPWYPELNPSLWYVKDGSMDGAVYAKDTNGVHCQIEFPNPYGMSSMRYFCSQNFTYFGDAALYGGY